MTNSNTTESYTSSKSKASYIEKEDSKYGITEEYKSREKTMNGEKVKKKLFEDEDNEEDEEEEEEEEEE